jgi:hypothetical protein
VLCYTGRMAPKPKPVEERFFSKVVAGPNCCWIWTGATCDGYGAFFCGGKNVGAHRWSYEFHVGQIPEGMQIDHLCRVRQCVNPSHLEPVSQAENIKRGLPFKPKPTSCPYGHPYNEENTIILASGHRGCRPCRRRATREWKARKKGTSR